MEKKQKHFKLSGIKKAISICRDCRKSLPEDSNSQYCSKCLALWHIDNEIPDDIPCGDFDEPQRREE